MSRAIAMVCFLMLFTRLVASPFHLLQSEPEWPANWYNAPPVVATGRSNIEAKLERCPGDHVVIVGYDKDFRSYDWVYNDAQVDGQKVIWARDLGAEENAEILRYYKGRHAWFVVPSDSNPQLVPYH
jgi:hypothetical protein